MNLQKQAQILAAALAIGAATLSLPASPAQAAIVLPDTHAEAKPRPRDNGVRCMLILDDGTMDFYLPGQQIWDPLTGKAKTCGADGKWHREGEAESPMAPRPDGGGVYAP